MIDQVVRVGDTAPVTDSYPSRPPAAGMEGVGKAPLTSPIVSHPDVDPLAHQVPTSLPLQQAQDSIGDHIDIDKKPTSPVNELDLQSELAAVSMPSPVKPEKSDDNVEDMEVGKAIPYSEPTSPAGTNVKDPLMDFVTSTPKKGDDEAMSDTEVSSEQTTRDSEYVTALSSMGGERSSSVQNLLEETSESTKTFASYLQTVTTSVDMGDDPDSAPSSFKSNFNEVSMDMESVFETLQENPLANLNETTTTVTDHTLVEKSEKTLITSDTTDTRTDIVSSKEAEDVSDAINEAVNNESPVKEKKAVKDGSEG